MTSVRRVSYISILPYYVGVILCVCARVCVCRSHDRSRLRLAAACGILSLARCGCYKTFISHSVFQTLALTVQVWRCCKAAMYICVELVHDHPLFTVTHVSLGVENCYLE